eukprot:8862879-Lingulodinium_polyedra.AAC.1
MRVVLGNACRLFHLGDLVSDHRRPKTDTRSREDPPVAVGGGGVHLGPTPDRRPRHRNSCNRPA